MNSLYSKNHSSVFTIDTFAPSTATFRNSVFQKDILQVPNQNFSCSYQLFTIDQDQPNPFINRFKVDIRQRYIYRVLGSQENQNLPSLKHQNVFVYDWDDTLLFTTYLKGKNFTELSEQCKKLLKQLDQIVSIILNSSLNQGYIFVITNSVNGWVTYSAKLYLPKVYQILMSSKRIKIWSAREMYQNIYPEDLKFWKIQAFKKIKQHFCTNILTNVICLGDRDEDMEACDVLVKDFSKILIKKIKFQQKPTPQQLIKQLKLLQKKFQQIFHAIANTTIKLAKRMLTHEQIKRKTQNNLESFIKIKIEEK